MHALTFLPFIAFAAASPLKTSTFDPCEFASPCINPDAPCPCPERPVPTSAITHVIERREPPKADPIVCTYKCPPCPEGQECPALCDPLPLDPRCDNRCEEACKPCREGKICPFICLPVTLPADCPAIDPPVSGPEETTIEARAAQVDTTAKPVDCSYKCPPCEEGQDCPGLCDPLPLDPSCPNRCTEACKPCREGLFCPAVCLPVTLPADCPATETSPPPAEQTIEARDTEEQDVCQFRCPPCKPGEDCGVFCDVAPLPAQCPNRCDTPQCKLCRPGRACPRICLPFTTKPADCPATSPPSNPSPTLEARAAEPIPDCTRKCADNASGICDPLQLPEKCPNRCDQGCKLCKGKICDIIKFPCLPITLPADCPAPSAPPTLKARTAEPDAAVPSCDLICPPCREGEDCPALCDPFTLPKFCPNRCDQACKPCREGANCPKICELITLPADCPASESQGVDKRQEDSEVDWCDPAKCWMPPCPPGHVCTQQCQTPPWCNAS